MLTRFLAYRSSKSLLNALTLVSTMAGCANNPAPRPEVAANAPTAAEPHNAGPVSAETPPARYSEPSVALKSTAPEEYVVVKSDTLWDIASEFLERPWFWPEIWRVNPQIDNPHLIYPGDVLTIVYIDGRPYIQVGDGPRIGGSSTIRLSPRVRVEALADDQNRVPVQSIQQFIIRPRVVSKEQLDTAPYILGAQDDRLIYGSGDRVYVRGPQILNKNERYSLFRPGQALRDPATRELLGYEAILIADAMVIKGGDPATVMLENSQREALKGDRLLPINEEQDRVFLPRAPARAINGVIISVFDAIRQIGQHQVAALNIGARDGIEKGHVLAVFQAGRTVGDPFATAVQSKSVVLPAEKAGVMMVFRTFEKVSYALVMDATRPIEVGDTVQPPE